MDNLTEYHDYKRFVASTILSDKTCVDLITNTNYTGALPATQLLEQVLSDGTYVSGQVHLYDYIPDAASSAKVHVCIEVDDNDIYNVAVGNFKIEIMIIVPVDLMNMYGNIRRDAIASRIDTLINGKTTIGFGRIERKPGSLGIPSEKARSRKLRYVTKDWNLHGDTLYAEQ